MRAQLNLVEPTRPAQTSLHLLSLEHVRATQATQGMPQLDAAVSRV